MQLVLETSGSLPFVVLQDNGKLLRSWVGPMGQHHSQTLLAGIDECLQGTSLTALSSIAVGIGPGMFTGLRIGLATAKFLADLHQIPLVPFSSLLAIALGAPLGAKRIWALNDARSKRVYALCLNSQDLDPLLANNPAEEQAWTPQEAATKMQAGDLLLGEGAFVYQSEWPAFVQIGTAQLQPEALARLGQALFLAKRLARPLDLEPRYLKTGQTHLP